MKFTIEQIKDAHSKVKSGADFPAYIQAIKALGVTNYEAYVGDGHIHYFGKEHSADVTAKYEPLSIASESNPLQFKSDLEAHQEGKTDFMTFCKDCAKSGVEKWVVDMNEMTCTYYDLAGNKVLVESIPH